MELDELRMRINQSGLDTPTKLAVLAILEDLLARVEALEAA